MIGIMTGDLVGGQHYKTQKKPFGMERLYGQTLIITSNAYPFFDMGFLTLFAFWRFFLFSFVFLAALPGLFAAELPDDAGPAELAVEAGVGAGPAGVQALLAIPEFHLLTFHAGLPVRVEAAISQIFH
jgi:hypothetical protein